GSRCRRIMWLPRWRSNSYPSLPSALTTPRPETTGSGPTLHLDQLLGDRRRDGVPVLLQALDVKRDSLPHASERLLAGRAVGHAAREGGDGGDEDAVLVSLDQDTVLHEGAGQLGRCSTPT